MVVVSVRGGGRTVFDQPLGKACDFTRLEMHLLSPGRERDLVWGKEEERFGVGGRRLRDLACGEEVERFGVRGDRQMIGKMKRKVERYDKKMKVGTHV